MARGPTKDLRKGRTIFEVCYWPNEDVERRLSICPLREAKPTSGGHARIFRV